MKRKHYLLDLFNGVDDRFVLEAAESREPARPAARKNRIVLIAALVALTALLAGCGILYVLHLQDLKVGSKDLVYQALSEDLTESWIEVVPQHQLSQGGRKGSKNYEAALEWFDFMQSYDPDGAIQGSVWGKEPTFPEEYYFYGPYTQEMVDKIDEIAQKYDLNLVGPLVKPVVAQNLLPYLGIDSMLAQNAPAHIDPGHTSFFENGYLDTWFQLYLDEGENRWTDCVMICYYYSSKDCFNTRFCELSEEVDWQEIPHTTPSGETVLVLCSPAHGRAWAFCDREDAMISVRMDIGTETTNAQILQIVDCLNFSIQPEPGDPALLGLPSVENSTAMVQSQNGCTVELKSAVTDGFTSYITFGITAPEGVDASRLSFEAYGLNPTTDPAERSSYSNTYWTVEDGDGLTNTADFILQWEFRDEESAPITPNSRWSVYLENLQNEIWTERGFETLWRSEGTWRYDFVFDDRNDFRELEFVKEPVTVSLPVGWTPDGKDVFDDVTISSIRLRSLGGEATLPKEHMGADLCDYANERYPQVVLKDGTAIALDSQLHLMNTQSYFTPIPLDEVDHLLLIDGTKLYPQE